MRRNKMPQLDLHPFSPQAAKSALRSFLIKALRRGTQQVCIIHGLGDGRLEDAMVEVLEEFGYGSGDYNYERGNCGATVVSLNPGGGGQALSLWKYRP